MPNAKADAPVIVIAKDSFATGLRTVQRGQLLPATDPIVKAKPHFFRAHPAGPVAEVDVAPVPEVVATIAKPNLPSKPTK